MRHSTSLSRAHRAGIALTVLGLFASVATQEVVASPELRAEVEAAERAFAQTMADRDLAAFATFVAQEAIFFGESGAIRGRAAVIEAWSPLFEAAGAPFSWEPVIVEVLQSGKLALSSGPVKDPAGKTIAVYNSIWRLEPDGHWRVIFDKGSSAEP